ncbi:hypothetical protein LXA43DRAFT_1104834 [Ganoderma leucocontextum]|nr:hypothetical protein LXA43DRAFT_1104834 [Ganoderma leucocontextum]
MSPRQLRWLKVTMEGDRDSSVVANVELLISMGKKDAESLSAEDLLRLHQAAEVVARFKHTFPTAPTFIFDADRLSQAVDDIVTFATSGDHDARIDLPWTVVWVDVPGSAPKFLATTNEHELAGMVGKGLYDDLVSRNWPPFDPSRRAGLGDVRMVEGSPGHFTGHGVVHCESALLQYVVGNRLPVEPYIGCSRPICYACVMLVKAYNEVSGKDLGAGCRCVDLAQLDIAWSYPPAMGLTVYRRLENGVRKDFNELFTQPIYSAYRPIVKLPWTGEVSGSGGP